MQRARRVAAEEGERLVQDVLVEPVAQVSDRALAGVGDERRREVGRDALEQIEQEDRERQPPDVDAGDERLVEDRLHLRHEQCAGCRVSRRRDPRRHEPAAIRPGVGEEPPEEPRLELQRLPDAAIRSDRLRLRRDRRGLTPDKLAPAGESAGIAGGAMTSSPWSVVT
jgi:hypothetical protein